MLPLSAFHFLLVRLLQQLLFDTTKDRKQGKDTQRMKPPGFRVIMKFQN